MTSEPLKRSTTFPTNAREIRGMHAEALRSPFLDPDPPSRIGPSFVTESHRSTEHVPAIGQKVTRSSNAIPKPSPTTPHIFTMASIRCLARPFTLPRAAAPTCRYAQAYRVIPAQRRAFTKTKTTIESSKPQRGGSKLFKSADEAVADIKSGSTILSSGFGLCGVAGSCHRLIPRIAQSLTVAQKPLFPRWVDEVPSLCTR